jgi:ABC-2 type transport system ATP-binding protein
VIINKGRVVAEDTPENLTRRLAGAGTLRLEIRGEEIPVLDTLRAVPGVLAARLQGGQNELLVVDVEAEAGRDVRAELASAVVAAGHGLLGLEQVGMSLEDIFLELTTTDQSAETAPAA